MADYGVNIAIKFNEAKLNKLTKQLTKASTAADRINKEFKSLGLSGKNSVEKINTALQKKIKNQGSVIKQLRQEVKLNQQNADAIARQNRASRSRPPGGGGGLGGGGRLSQAVLGGGFPLLFGGGPLQGLGGAAGRALGGFAGGIAGQIIVGQFEQLGRAAAEVGQAFSATTFDLERVAEATGIAGSETQKFLEKIEKYGSSAQAAELATKLLATKVGEDGVQALTKFGDDAQTLGNNLGVIFTQVLSEIARVAGPLLEALAKFAGEQASIGAFKKRTGLTGKEKLAQDILSGGTFTGGGGRLGGGVAETLQKATAKRLGLTDLSDKGLRNFAIQTALGSQKKFELPVLQQIKSTAAGIQTPEQQRAAGKTARELEREAERFQKQRQRFEEQQAKAIERRLEAQFKESQELQNQETLLRAKLAGNEEEVRYAIELGQLQEKYGTEEGRRLADKKAAIRASTEALKEQEVAQQRINSLVNTAGQQFTGLFETLINGTNDWNSALRNVLTSLSSALLRFGLSALGGDDGVGLFSIFSGTFTGKGKALGGAVSAGQSYLVGEKGPELFMPGAKGNIIPNSALGGMGGGSITVNVDAKGSTVEGNGDQANQLGKVIGAAIQQELIKQKKPGGLLA